MLHRLWYGIERRRWQLQLLDLYYNGEQAMRQLGISLPPQMRMLRNPVGWPAIAVESLEERIELEGFRYPGVSGGDDDLWSIWQANEMQGESGLAHLDAFVFGHAYVTVGAGDDPAVPVITVESPLDMAVDWDARSKKVLQGLRRYTLEGEEAATLYAPAATFYVVRSASGWEVVDVDDHNLGRPPVERLSNRQRTHDRVGKSEITAEVMALTDAAARTLVGAEVSREFFAAPQRYILGAQESAFVDAEGNPKGAWQTYIGRILALEADENGNLPQVGQFPVGDPSAYSKLVDMYGKEFASRVGLPPHYLGFTTDNPASADAIRSSEARLVKRAERRIAGFAGTWRRVMRLALLVRDSRLPDQSHLIEPIFRDPATPTVAAQADATVKLVQAGILPAESDVTARRVGLTADEIAQVKIDRKSDRARQLLAELANSLEAKQARTAGTVAHDISQPPTSTPAPAAPPAK